MSSPKVLLTGATGYIGGSVLNQLLTSPTALLPSQITVLIRGDSERAARFHAVGLKVLHFASLDDTDTIEAAAAAHDIAIGTTLGYHTPSALAIIKGLAKRKASRESVSSEDGQVPIAYIHTDGTSNLSDLPVSRTYLHPPGRIFSDVEDDIHAYMQSRQAEQTYIQRTTSLAVIEAGQQHGIPTYTLMAPTIYGRGTGARFGSNLHSVMIPIMIRAAITHGQSAVIGDGSGEYEYVHMEDLAVLYEMLLNRVLSKAETPHGARGVFFAATGRYRWLEAAQLIGRAGFELGALKTDEVERLSLEQAAARFRNGDKFLAETGLAGNARTSADWAERWGWQPVHTERDWEASFRDDFEVVMGSEKAFGADYQQPGKE